MKKKFNPVYTVDVTHCLDDRDMIVAFAAAKVKAGLPISSNEYFATIYQTIDATMCASNIAEKLADNMISSIKTRIKPIKRPNVFKRVWNWVARKK